MRDECEINVSEQEIDSLINNAAVVEYIDTQEAEGIMLAHSTTEKENFVKTVQIIFKNRFC